jgi:hypothetical protein
MFIDSLNYEQCWDLWTNIHLHPVKMARSLFPKRPPLYVVVTKLIGAYASNKGTALGIAREMSDEAADADDIITLSNTMADLRKRRMVYTDIAASLYCRIPAWGRSIKLPEKEN